MKDPRVQKLCHQLIHYSCELTKGQRVLIEMFGHQPELVAALVSEAYAAGAEPIVRLRDMTVQRALMRGASAEKWGFEAENDAALMRQKAMTGFTGRSGNDELGTGFWVNEFPRNQIEAVKANYFWGGR